MNSLSKIIWVIIIALGITIAVSTYIFFFADITREEMPEEHIIPEEDFSKKIFIQGELVQGVKECGNFHCFKVKVLTSNREEFLDSVKEITTNMPIELGKEKRWLIYGEEKNGTVFADWKDIIEETAYRKPEGFE